MEGLRLEGTFGGHLAQLLLQQGQPEQSAQGHVQAAFGDLKEGDSTVSGHHVPVLSHLHS